ncbi:MAG: hypothetical protein QOF77_2322 [Solirubrobacteraceae bacterium]|jgi:hypothetical protein|nr:hypothetical protein [Solirubrobacteraceae bacterium]
MGAMEGSASPAAYRLDQLGWLQFERLATLVLDFEAGITGLGWRDVGSHGRLAWVEGPVVLPDLAVRLPGPVAVAGVWIRGDPAHPHRRRAWDPTALRALDFPAGEDAALERLDGHAARRLAEDPDPETRLLAEHVLRRLRRVAPAPAPAGSARPAAEAGLRGVEDAAWWVPEDIEAPPSTDPVSSRPAGLTCQQLDRVLSDL